ncbi:MAG: hypothetical protein KKC75_01065 [Nanoarchaeota archaeon]|nr:hypothetical protein [Nanoarchaeota archaeon]MBU1005892.1 hypothetical protein [Nanoarchaeota archaeon]MBU1946531.1 hypothetical protein [Nanoarchaeota archaeon]
MIRDILKNLSDGFLNIAEKTESGFKRAVSILEDRAELMLRRIKKKVFRLVFEVIFFSAGIVLLLAGVLLFLKRFLPADIVLIGAGIVCLYILMLMHWISK